MALSGLVGRLQAAAFARAPLEEANQAIEQAREARAAGGRPAVSYEVVLPALDPDRYLTHQVLPRLVYFLDCRGVPLAGAPGVVVSLFTAEGLAFVGAGEVVAVLAEARGLDLLTLAARYGERGTGDPPLLGS